MRVTIKLFAGMRDVAGSGELVRDVPDDARVADVWNALAAEFPRLAPYRRSLWTAVNATYAKPNARVQEGDEIAFLPPVSGG